MILGSRDLPEHQDHKVLRDHRERRVQLVLQERPEHLGQLEHLVLQGRLVLRDPVDR